MFVDKKAQEISLALIKTSVYARRNEFRKRLELLSFRILEEAALRDYVALSNTIAVLDGLLRFGRTIYEIEPVNAEMLLRELRNLNDAVRRIADFSLPDLAQLPEQERIFPVPQSLFTEAQDKGAAQANNPRGEFGNAAIRQSGNNEGQANQLNAAITAMRQNAATEANAAIERNAAIDTNAASDKNTATVSKAATEANAAIEANAENAAIRKSGNKTKRIARQKKEQAGEIDAGSGNGDNPEIRQARLIEYVGKSGDTPLPLRDITSAFPDVSARTIRYDLERLCSQGIIERIGAGGPGNRYKIRVI
jgi:hypothetical protein